MATPASLITGTALSLTVGFGYATCSLLFWIWPEAAASFMNGLFHGLDFRKLQSGQVLFDFGAFGYALLVLMAWAFALGAVFASVRRALAAPGRTP